MHTPQNTSSFIAFLDECGDHSLEKIDKDFPLFLLSTIVVKRAEYAEKIIPELAKFKLKFWSHEGVNLHSRDIRRALHDFAFMQVPNLRGALLEELNLMMKDLPFTLFLTAVDKTQHKNRHENEATNPYSLALGYTLENIGCFLKENGETEISVVAESRGKNEDNQLKESFYQLTDIFESTYKIRFLPVVFRRKSENIAGIQIADLCAYPAARKILNPQKSNLAFDAVKTHIYAFNSW